MVQLFEPSPSAPDMAVARGAAAGAPGGVNTSSLVARK